MVNMANRANVHMGLVSCVCFLGLGLCCKVPPSKWHCTLREKMDEEECLMDSRARRRIWAGDQSKKAIVNPVFATQSITKTSKHYYPLGLWFYIPDWLAIGCVNECILKTPSRYSPVYRSCAEDPVRKAEGLEWQHVFNNQVDSRDRRLCQEKSLAKYHKVYIHGLGPSSFVLLHKGLCWDIGFIIYN